MDVPEDVYKRQGKIKPDKCEDVGEILRPFLVRNSINLVFLFIKTLRNFIYDTKTTKAERWFLYFAVNESIIL